MTDYTVKRLALVLAVQAEIEGMKAINERDKQENWRLTYSKEEFDSKSLELTNLAHCHDDQL